MQDQGIANDSNRFAGNESTDGQIALPEEHFVLNGQMTKFLAEFRDFRDLMRSDPKWMLFNTENWKIIPGTVRALSGLDSISCNIAMQYPFHYIPTTSSQPMGYTMLRWPADDLPILQPSFSQVHDLPTEVRLSIWEYALPDPRVIPITVSHLPYTPIDKLLWAYVSESNEKLIQSFMTGKEAMRVFLQNYGFLRVTKGQIQSKGIYLFDMKRDTLVIDLREISQISAMDIKLNLDGLRSLGLQNVDPVSILDCLPIVDEMFPNLKELTTISGEWKFFDQTTRLHDVDCTLRYAEAIFISGIDTPRNDGFTPEVGDTLDAFIASADRKREILQAKCQQLGMAITHFGTAIVWTFAPLVTCLHALAQFRPIKP